MKMVLDWFIAHWVWFAFAAYMLWELWLGKTQKIKANSTLEALGNALALFLRGKLPAPLVEAADKIEGGPDGKA